MNDISAEIFKATVEAVSERLSRYGIPKTGTIERDIARTILARIATAAKPIIVHDEEGLLDSIDRAGEIGGRDQDAAVKARLEQRA